MFRLFSRGSQANPPKFLTVAETASFTTLSVRTIKSSIAQGKLRVRRIGRRVIVPLESVQKFLGA